MSGSEALKSEASSSIPSKKGTFTTVKGSRNTRVPRGVSLAALFGVAFAVSYSLVVAISSLFFQENHQPIVRNEDGEKDPIVADPLLVNAAGTALRVANHPLLNPSSESDLLLYVWVKLRKPVLEGDRVAFLAKFDVTSDQRPGYSLALVGGPDGVRPSVYWQNDHGEGRWYSFAPTQLKAKEWYLVALSFRQGRYLGLHLMPAVGAKKPEVLGGYDLQPAIFPQTQVDLIVGAFGASKFRGRVGPFGVVRRENLSDELTGLIVELAKNPGEVPKSLSRQEVILAATPKEDLGPLKLSIKTLGAKAGAPTGVVESSDQN